MITIDIDDNTVEVDASVLAQAFRIDTDDLKRRMRDGTITCQFERGEGADAGRVRLSFYSPDRRIRMIADTGGHVLTCSAANYSWPVPAVSGSGGADDAARKARLDTFLDLALQDTFPASDPISPDLGRTD